MTLNTRPSWDIDKKFFKKISSLITLLNISSQFKKHNKNFIFGVFLILFYFCKIFKNTSLRDVPWDILDISTKFHDDWFDIFGDNCLRIFKKRALTWFKDYTSLWWHNRHSLGYFEACQTNSSTIDSLFYKKTVCKNWRTVIPRDLLVVRSNIDMTDVPCDIFDFYIKFHFDRFSILRDNRRRILKKCAVTWSKGFKGFTVTQQTFLMIFRSLSIKFQHDWLTNVWKKRLQKLKDYGITWHIGRAIWD